MEEAICSHMLLLMSLVSIMGNHNELHLAERETSRLRPSLGPARPEAVRADGLTDGWRLRLVVETDFSRTQQNPKASVILGGWTGARSRFSQKKKNVILTFAAVIVLFL